MESIPPVMIVTYVVLLVSMVKTITGAESERKRREIARTTDDLTKIVELSRDRSWFVRDGLSFNDNTPLEMLVWVLSKDKNEQVSESAQNRAAYRIYAAVTYRNSPDLVKKYKSDLLYITGQRKPLIPL
jgi:hypothetical protein